MAAHNGDVEDEISQMGSEEGFYDGLLNGWWYIYEQLYFLSSLIKSINYTDVITIDC